ncbi:MAG: hypothetical protein HRU38_12935 [Saccharospirillaceae bacterium]|nr:hypothetical protein [Pseudomonadales bacterium]NRB79549.1 hypothetical protein [Saccharospirillaceae bacterium]
MNKGKSKPMLNVLQKESSLLKSIFDSCLFIVFMSLLIASFLKSMGNHDFSLILEGWFGGDKQLHVFAGCIVTLLIYRTLDRLLIDRSKLIRVIYALLISLGVFSLEEYLQGFNVSRVASWEDWIASLTGILIGLGLIGLSWFIPRFRNES